MTFVEKCGGGKEIISLPLDITLFFPTHLLVLLGHSTPFGVFSRGDDSSWCDFERGDR